MINIALILFFSFMAYRITKVVRKESDIFREYNQSRSFALLALLFPLGPIVYIFSVFRLGLLPAIFLMAVCYLPSLIAAKKCMSVFERAGTDRVRKAHNSAIQAFGTAITGLVYSLVLFSLGFIGVSNA